MALTKLSIIAEISGIGKWKPIYEVTTFWKGEILASFLVGIFFWAVQFVKGTNSRKWEHQSLNYLSYKLTKCQFEFNIKMQVCIFLPLCVTNPGSHLPPVQDKNRCDSDLSNVCWESWISVCGLVTSWCVKPQFICTKEDELVQNMTASNMTEWCLWRGRLCSSPFTGKYKLVSEINVLSSST